MGVGGWVACSGARVKGVGGVTGLQMGRSEEAPWGTGQGPEHCSYAAAGTGDGERGIQASPQAVPRTAQMVSTGRHLSVGASQLGVN